MTMEKVNIFQVFGLVSFLHQIVANDTGEKKCTYGFDRSGFPPTCIPDIRVKVSNVFNNTAYCNYVNGFFNKKGNMYFPTSKNFRKLCVMDSTRCSAGWIVLPGELARYLIVQVILKTLSKFFI